MKIGIPKEIKTDESRVAIVPSGVDVLTRAAHQVLIIEGGIVGMN